MRSRAIGVLMLLTTVALGDVSDDFEGYDVGGPALGIWQDAASWIDNPTNPAPTALVVETTDAMGNLTQAVQIQDGIGSSGGIIGRVNSTTVQRFETDLRLDQLGNGSQPNWAAATGFLQETDQPDFNWMPQAFVYTNASRRFRLFVQNADGQGGQSRDFGLGAFTWSFDTWYRIVLEVDTESGVFGVSITDLETADVLFDQTRTYSGWNREYGQYDAISINDGEYGSNPGTIGNMASIDNVVHVATPGCAADLDGDNDADADDFFAYLDAFANGDFGVCDIDLDGDCDADDFFGYLDLFARGC